MFKTSHFLSSRRYASFHFQHPPQFSSKPKFSRNVMLAANVPQVFVAGLGNLPYPATRHSVGQLVVDALAHEFGISLTSDRGGFCGQGNVLIGSTTINLTLYKSKSLMNISGPSIVKAYREAVNTPTSMIILSDSLSHRVGALSVKLGGSANGHNGLKSIISALGGETNFYRFRLGIGRNESDAAEYVMGKLSSYERRFWGDEGLELVIHEIGKVAQKVS